jgi:hypothetical protein
MSRINLKIILYLNEDELSLLILKDITKKEKFIQL